MANPSQARPVETEIKLVATAGTIAALAAHPLLAGAAERADLITTYYDTAGEDLRRAGASLRVREAGALCEQTLKLRLAGGAAVRRTEWTAPAPGGSLQPERFAPAARRALAKLAGKEPLVAVAGARVARATWRLALGDGLVEAVLDRGTIAAGGREEAVCELELEVVRGSLADALRLAQQLPLGPDLCWSVRGKAERAYLLAHDRRAEVVRAGDVGLSAEMDIAAGFRAVAWSCLAQLLANYPLLIAAGEPEPVHQCRVALRRLRAAFTLFRDILDDHEGRLLKAELKAVAGVLGAARDLHVLIGLVGDTARAARQDAAELLAHLREREARATQAAQELLAGAAFQRLLFTVALWLEDGDWLTRVAERGGDRPLAPFAAKVLGKRRRKLRTGKRLAAMSPARRHRLRIKAKQLRYGAEFFAALFPDRSAQRAFGKAVGRLQDALGELNDLGGAMQAEAVLFDDLEPIAAARLRALAADILGERAGSADALIDKAQKALNEVCAAKPWWKGRPRG